jgi:hypothetical protein
MQLSEETVRWIIQLAVMGLSALVVGILRKIQTEITRLNDNLTTALRSIDAHNNRLNFLERVLRKIPCVQKGFICTSTEQEDDD